MLFATHARVIRPSSKTCPAPPSSARTGIQFQRLSSRGRPSTRASCSACQALLAPVVEVGFIHEDYDGLLSRQGANHAPVEALAGFRHADAGIGDETANPGLDRVWDSQEGQVTRESTFSYTPSEKCKRVFDNGRWERGRLARNARSADLLGFTSLLNNSFRIY